MNLCSFAKDRVTHVIVVRMPREVKRFVFINKVKLHYRGVLDGSCVKLERFQCKSTIQVILVRYTFVQTVLYTHTINNATIITLEYVANKMKFTY